MVLDTRDRLKTFEGGNQNCAGKKNAQEAAKRDALLVSVMWRVLSPQQLELILVALYQSLVSCHKNVLLVVLRRLRTTGTV